MMMLEISVSVNCCCYLNISLFLCSALDYNEVLQVCRASEINLRTPIYSQKIASTKNHTLFDNTDQ